MEPIGTVLSGPRAGFWRRFAASFVDGICLSIVGFVLRAAVGGGAGSGLGFLITGAYFTAMIGRAEGQTLGQMALGIRVIDFSTGGPIGYPRALLRWIVSYISALVLLLGYLWMLWDREKQTWHDKAANAVVVPVADSLISSAAD
jgi:uncharacterized RDD family membrane protein YckC